MIIATDKEICNITEKLTTDFTNGDFDLSARPKEVRADWCGMPEYRAVIELKNYKVDSLSLRIFLTLVSALDWNQDSDRLWKAATELYKTSPWIFEPITIKSTPLLELRRKLRKAGVIKRHNIDVVAWKLLGEVLICPESPCAVRDVIWQGEGDAGKLLSALNSKDKMGQPWFPYLSGPKVSVVWIREMVVPGEAKIHNIELVPVGVDKQVRKVTENLMIVDTCGMSEAKIRSTIQEAWRRGASRAVGPEPLKGTSAALDPALWFFGRWGCSFCEKSGCRMPISEVCQRCQLP